MTTLREAAQQALEAYDAHEPLAVVMEALRPALAEPEQEPVAWADEGTLKWHIPNPQTSVRVSMLRGKHALYTHPVDDTALLRQALEALENTSPMGFNIERDKQFFAAITALRERLGEKT
jgi:hypothetical protein